MRLFRLLFLLSLIVPLFELYLLLLVGGLIGPMPTIAMVIFTALVGGLAFKIEGFNTWLRLRQCLAQGKIPALEIVEGPILLVGSALLLTPGFFTDFLGFLCLLPATRRKIARYVLAKLIVTISASQTQERTLAGEFQRRG